jgi:hypothetical protein
MPTKLVKEKFTIPLWDKFSKETLIKEQEKIGSKKAFDRGFHLKAYSDIENTFPSFFRCKKRINPQEIVNYKWPKFAGIDPFGKNIVIFVIAVSPAGIRYPIDIQVRIPRDKLMHKVIEVRERYKLKLIMLEDNSAQIFIADGIRLLGGKDFPIATQSTTGMTKKAGIATLETEFSQDLWFWPAGKEDHDYDCKCGFCMWEEEMSGHPNHGPEDTLIACYYAKEAIRMNELNDFCGYEEIDFF